MTHWCRDIPRDEAVRAAEDNRSGPLPTLEEAIGMLAKIGSASSAPQHENKGNDMATKAEIQRAEYRAEASEQPAPAPPATDGLRTERVVLEITHFWCRPVAEWAWPQMIRLDCPGESVRVVEEVAIDAGWAERLEAERDAAIRERDEFREQLKSAPAASGAAGTEAKE